MKNNNIVGLFLFFHHMEKESISRIQNSDSKAGLFVYHKDGIHFSEIDQENNSYKEKVESFNPRLHITAIMGLKPKAYFYYENIANGEKTTMLTIRNFINYDENSVVIEDLEGFCVRKYNILDNELVVSDNGDIKFGKCEYTEIEQ
jgi:hypothetical protein